MRMIKCPTCGRFYHKWDAAIKCCAAIRDAEDAANLEESRKEKATK